MFLREEGASVVVFAKVIKSLGKLMQVRASGASDMTTTKFGGKIRTVCTYYYNDFSYDTSKEIEIWADGNKQDISLNDCLFSFIIKGKEGRTNSRGYCHYLTLQGCWSNSETFSFDISLSSQMEELVSIIYAMVILSEIKDIEKAKILWNVISQHSYCQNAAIRLQWILEGENFSKKIADKYPFMVQAMKDGLQFQINRAKEEISNLQFMKR